MKNQAGKSIVEMLAVLAIMGVLSIIAIMAYHYSMTKYQANELVHQAYLGYVEVKKTDTNAWVDLSVNDNLQGYTYNDTSFILADNVEKEVCNRLVNDKTDFTLLTLENTKLTTCESKTDIVFDFANMGSMEFSCQSDTDCFKGQYCSSISDSCITPDDCLITSFWNKNKDTCESCPINSSTGKTDEMIGNNGCYCVVDYFLYNDSCIHRCEYEMLMAGYDNQNYTVSDSTISYVGEMRVDEMLDLKGCNLEINGVLSVGTSGDLTVDDITVRKGMNSSISNLSYTDQLYGIWNSGSINAENVDVLTDNLISTGKVNSAGIYNNYGNLSATTIKTISGDNSLNSSVNYSYLSGMYSLGGKITADKITAIGGNSNGYMSAGLYLLWNGQIKANTIVATGNNALNSYGIGIENTSIIDSSTIYAQSKGSYSIRYGYVYNTGIIITDTLYYCPANIGHLATLKNASGGSVNKIKNC